MENHGGTEEKGIVELEAGRALRGKRVLGTLGKGGELVGCVPACKVVAPVRADLGPEPFVATVTKVERTEDILTSRGSGNRVAERGC